LAKAVIALAFDDLAGCIGDHVGGTEMVLQQVALFVCGGGDTVIAVSSRIQK
jgi:hypothetical protein